MGTKKLKKVILACHKEPRINKINPLLQCTLDAIAKPIPIAWDTAPNTIKPRITTPSSLQLCRQGHRLDVSLGFPRPLPLFVLE